MKEAKNKIKIPAQVPESYRMPAEWEAQRGVWLTWPRPEGISFPDRYELIPPVYKQLFNHLIQGEEVNINAWDEETAEKIRAYLDPDCLYRDRFFCVVNPSYEPWCRDHGPIFVKRRTEVSANYTLVERAIVDWKYNAWGGKYPPYDLDDRVPELIAMMKGLPIFHPNMILEGGSIDVNGEGSLLTTKSCLLNPNRNPNLTQVQIEANLKKYLGVSNILWLEDGIEGDDTDGHVDDITRFVAADTVVTVVESNPQDPNYKPLQRNLELLQGMKDQDGRSLQVVLLPMPDPVYWDGQRLPASYANFFIGNEMVIMPTYRCKKDEQARGILQELFPQKKVCGIDSTDLVWGLGSFHCISQQEPY